METFGNQWKSMGARVHIGHCEGGGFTLDIGRGERLSEKISTGKPLATKNELDAVRNKSHWTLRGRMPYETSHTGPLRDKLEVAGLRKLVLLLKKPRANGNQNP